MVKKAKLKLGEDGYEAQFVGIVTSAIMEVVDRKMDDINRGLHVVLEKRLDDFKVYGDAISGINDNIKSINNNIYTINNRLDTIDNRLDNIESDVYDLKGDVGQIKSYIFTNVEPRMHVLEFRDQVA